MKRKLINSFLVLSASTMITKVFSILNRMMLSRLLDEQGMALYILVIPTLSLCITLAQFSIPSAVFRLVSNPKYNNKKVIFSATLICIVSCLCIMCGLTVFSRMIAIDFLKQEKAFYPILAMLPFIPLVAISGIVKNYFLGREDVWNLSIAQLLEEVARIIFTYFIIKALPPMDIQYLVTVAILAMSIGELCSIGYLMLRLKRKTTLRKPTKVEFEEHFLFKDLMNIALPLTGSRMIHTCYNFLEPIILVLILTGIGVNEGEIHLQYAVISGYVISILLTPTFFNNVVLRLLIPILNRDIAANKMYDLRKHVLVAVIVCLFISIPFTCLFYFWGDKCLLIMYNTTNGYDYLKYMSIPFTLFYLQTPLSATLQALNKNKEMFFMSILECLIEFILLIVLTPYYGVLSVAIVLLVGLFITLLLSVYHVYQYAYKESARL